MVINIPSTEYAQRIHTRCIAYIGKHIILMLMSVDIKKEKRGKRGGKGKNVNVAVPRSTHHLISIFAARNDVTLQVALAMKFADVKEG